MGRRSKSTPDPLVVLLREWRLALGWSVEGLALRAGVNRTTVQELENGNTRSGRLETIRALAAPMGLALRLVPRTPQDEVT